MSIVKHFEKMGAKAEELPPISADRRPRLRRFDRLVSRTDGRAQVILNERGFRLQSGQNTEWIPLQVDVKDRHLLLLAKDGGEKFRFLCGHDERDWFVAAVPEPVSTIDAAKDSLKPPGVRAADSKLAAKRRQRRRNQNRLRQGEWFFVPEQPPIAVDVIQRNEPLFRAGGTPHMMQECFRYGGQPVMVSGRTEYTMEEWNAIPTLQRDMLAVQRERDPIVYCRGTVRHPDHATIHLNGWHRVYMNTENRAPGRERMTFYD